MIFTMPTQVPIPQDPVIAIIRPAEEKPKPKEPKLYTFKENDNLTTVSDAQSVDLKRVWAKNTQLTNPDVIAVGTVVTIPEADEVLPAREMPVSISSTTSSDVLQRTAIAGGSSSSGNTYYAGQCVWYLKNILAWVQNGWGNANQWIYTSGHAVGATPVVGAVAAAKGYNHVALVTGISGSNIQISEMNARGVGVISTRTTPISEWLYIYP